MHNINCGPGHGISIGGLGKDNAKAIVSNVTVQNANMKNTLTGVRIKTWQVKKISDASKISLNIIKFYFFLKKKLSPSNLCQFN